MISITLVVQAKRLLQETHFELWVPLQHANWLHHWGAATNALDHVILTAAALESVLEGNTSHMHTQVRTVLCYFVHM